MSNGGRRRSGSTGYKFIEEEIDKLIQQIEEKAQTEDPKKQRILRRAITDLRACSQNIEDKYFQDDGTWYILLRAMRGDDQ
jgi:hypothetical protein